MHHESTGINIGPKMSTGENVGRCILCDMENGANRVLGNVVSALEHGKVASLTDHKLSRIFKSKRNLATSLRLLAVVRKSATPPHVRQFASHLLGMIAHHGVLPDLQALVHSNNRSLEIREYCAEIIAQIGDSRSLSQMSKILDTSAPDSLKTVVVFALKPGRLSGADKRRAAELLPRVLKSAASPELKIQAIDAARVLGARRVKAQLRNILRNEDPRIRSHAIHAASDLSLKDVVPELKDIVRKQRRISGWERLQADALEGIVSLTGRKSFPLLAKVAEGRDAYLAAVACREIARTRFRRGLHTIRRLLANEALDTVAKASLQKAVRRLGQQTERRQTEKPSRAPVEIRVPVRKVSVGSTSTLVGRSKFRSLNVGYVAKSHY